MNKKSTLVFALFCGLFLISGTIDLGDLFNYANQSIPSYITEDNTPNDNPITDAGATLGRVLFYDKKLSVNNTISCASCHKQEFAFGDTATVSIGWDGGVTGRHSPRLINARFGEEESFFWDERASSLEEQSTMPIQDHIEMGFSNLEGNPGFDSLVTKIEGLDYYEDLFTFVYGDFTVTEGRIQDALAQFVRSIQSFDSKFDIGRAQVNNNQVDFPNFTDEENLGKTLFLTNAQGGGANCNTCHNAPEFDIDDNSRNNSVISVAGDPSAIDVNNTRSPTLRDMVNPDGTLNGPLMHDGSFTTLMEVIDLYDDIPVDDDNTNLDNRLSGGPGNQGQNLNLTQEEKDALVAFLETLTGSDVYTAEQWSDPFDADGNITILPEGALPVTLSSFQLFEDGDAVLLRWTTSSESNNEGFEIQRSPNAINWEKIGFVDGMGDSRELIDYSFWDEEVASGYNYYRLKQIDFDGFVEYSNTLAYYKKDDTPIVVYPNPVQDFLQVNLPEGTFTATIMNTQGQVLRTAQIQEKAQLDFSDLNSGIYLLVLTNGSREEIKKIIKP